MTRVIHTGDTHIGYRQYHSIERREDFLRAFQQVIEDAIRMDVAAVVHAGDLFHDLRPDLEDLLETLSVLRRLEAADIPFLAIVGNHERTRERQWLDLFEQLGLAIRLGSKGNRVGDVTFYGLDYVPRSQREALTYEFEPPESEFSSLVAHGLFEPFEGANWDTEELLGRASVNFDAMLLGDNHIAGQNRVGDTVVTYCGSTERTSAAEEEARGYNVVTFDDRVQVTRRSLDDTREFAFVDIDLAPGEGLDRIRDRIGERDVEDAVLVVRIDGEGESIPPAAVEELALAEGALLARVVDRREFEEHTETQVSFADPALAIEERLRDLPLSEAGTRVESILRDDGVADSNVRDRITETVSALLEEEGVSAFDPPEERDESEDSIEQQVTEPDEQTDGDGQRSITEFR